MRSIPVCHFGKLWSNGYKSWIADILIMLDEWEHDILVDLVREGGPAFIYLDTWFHGLLGKGPHLIEINSRAGFGNYPLICWSISI